MAAVDVSRVFPNVKCILKHLSLPVSLLGSRVSATDEHAQRDSTEFPGGLPGILNFVRTEATCPLLPLKRNKSFYDAEYRGALQIDVPFH